jgi:hypothetical protein
VALTARQIIQSFLEEYQLGSLGDWAWTLYTTSGTEDINEFVRGQLTVELPKQEAFKVRFPAYEQLRASGRGISVDQYRQYEKDAVDLAHTYGLPMAMFEDRDYLAQMMISDVSGRELEQRMVINREAAYNAPPEVRSALEQMYGVGRTAEALTAYYFDPDKALPILQQQFQASQIAGASLQQGIATDQATAERLAQQGVTFEQAQQGFRQVANDRALTYGAGDTVGSDTATAAAFGNQAAQAETTRVRKARQGAFASGGGAAESQKGVSGLGSTSR